MLIKYLTLFCIMTLMSCQEQFPILYYEGIIVQNPDTQSTINIDTFEAFWKIEKRPNQYKIYHILENAGCKTYTYKIKKGKVESIWYELNEYKNRMFFLDKELSYHVLSTHTKEQELYETKNIINGNDVTVNFEYNWFNSMPQSYSGTITQTKINGREKINFYSKSTFNTPPIVKHSSYDLEVIEINSADKILELELLFEKTCP